MSSFPKLTIRSVIDPSEYRALGFTKESLQDKGKWWATFARRYRMLLIEFFDEYFDVRLQTADYNVTELRRLPYSRIKVWMDRLGHLYIGIDHPDAGTVYTTLETKDIRLGSWRDMFSIVRKGKYYCDSYDSFPTRKLKF